MERQPKNSLKVHYNIILIFPHSFTILIYEVDQHEEQLFVHEPTFG